MVAACHHPLLAAWTERRPRQRRGSDKAVAAKRADIGASHYAGSYSGTRSGVFSGSGASRGSGVSLTGSDNGTTCQRLIGIPISIFMPLIDSSSGFYFVAPEKLAHLA